MFKKVPLLAFFLIAFLSWFNSGLCCFILSVKTFAVSETGAVPVVKKFSKLTFASALLCIYIAPCPLFRIWIYIKFPFFHQSRPFVLDWPSCELKAKSWNCNSLLSVFCLLSDEVCTQIFVWPKCNWRFWFSVWSVTLTVKV